MSAMEQKLPRELLGVLGCLPETSFVPFSVAPVPSASVLFHNSELSGLTDSALVDRYAFSVPDAGEAASSSQVFWAERYGGEGLTYNGGGVRVGVRDGFQLKGIGRNPLAGQGNDFWYSHGGCALEEALVELVWGEVLDQLLPHGAVRCAAVLDTQQLCAQKGRDGERLEVPRALLVRESALRPAHFQRASAFRPQALMKGLPSDAERTRAAIATLPDALPRLRGTEEAAFRAQSDTERLGRGLVELSLRLAEQLARARALRIQHGAITASNLALDGRWIDFSTTSALRARKNVILGANEPFFSDERHFIGVFHELSFYIKKYFAPETDSRLPTGPELEQIFRQRLGLCLAYEFASLSGWVEARAPERMSAEEAALGACLYEIAAKNGGSAREGICDERAELDLDLERALWVLSGTKPEHWEASLCHLIPREGERTRLLSCYSKLLEGVLSGRSSPEQARLRRRARARALQSSKIHPLLYRHRLAEALARLRTRHESAAEFRVGFGQFLQRIKAETALLSQSHEEYSVLMESGEKELRWIFASGEWVLAARGEERDRTPASFARESAEFRSLAVRAERFWGRDVLEILRDA